MADKYSKFGPTPRTPSCMQRSHLLSIDFKVTSLTEWAAQLKMNPLYAILSGFEVGNTPGVCTFYDFLNRLWNSDDDHMSPHIHPLKTKIKKPKTKAGIRTIPLTDRACDAFREQRKQNFQAGIFCTFEIEGVTDFVFLTKNGRPMMPNALNNVLYNIVKNYNSCTDGTQTIEQFSSHVMRHTGCTNMARAGINVKATQYVMGHAHSDVTMDVYNHLNNKTDVKLEFSKFEKNGTKMVQ